MQSLKQARINHQSAKGREFKQYFRFAETILEEANNTFSVMHNKIFRKAWNNSITARLNRNQVYTDWTHGVYECYIPTQAHAEVSCLQFYRIVIKVVPEIDYQTARNLSIELQKSLQKPCGFIGSELIVLIAPKLKKRGFIRGFQHIKKKGFLTSVFVNPNPLIIMKRLLYLLIKFFKTRISRLLEKLEFQPWQYDYKKKEYLYYSKLIDIIEGFSYFIASTLRVLSHSLNWFMKRLKQTLSAIGRQNMGVAITRKTKQLKTLLESFRFDKSEIGSRLRKETETVLNSLESISETEKSMKQRLKPKCEVVKVPIRLCLQARYTCGG